MAEFPSGTVTLLVTDVEASTELLERIGEEYAEVLDAQRRLIREAVAACSGREIDCRGEEFLFGFARARDALQAAVTAQRALHEHPWPGGAHVNVRMGLHTGEPVVRDDGYLGLDVHRGARICACARGGQILVSHATYGLVAGFEPEGATLVDAGAHALKGLSRPERLFHVATTGERLPQPLVKQEAASAFIGREDELAGRIRGVRRGRRRARNGGTAGELGLAELGWRARSLLPATPDAEREALAALGGDLFAAARSAADVDRYLDRVDRKGLAQRLGEYQELRVVSRAAAREAEVCEQQLADIDRLVDARATVAVATGEVGAALEGGGPVQPLRERVQALSALLDDGLAAAQSHLGPMSLRLRRTWARGVYRLGSLYAVRYYDGLGIERTREFETMTDARRFRIVARKREQEYRRSEVSHGAGGPGATGMPDIGGDGGGGDGGS